LKESKEWEIFHNKMKKTLRGLNSDAKEKRRNSKVPLPTNPTEENTFQSSKCHQDSSPTT
jgi:hypothetical protein